MLKQGMGKGPKEAPSRSLLAYFDEVRRLPLYTAEQERKLFTRYSQATSEAKGELAKKISLGYLRFVIQLARRQSSDPETLAELICAGNFGLMYSIPRYVLERGTRFLTYAAGWIRAFMQDAQHKRGQVRLPSHVRKKQRTSEILQARGLPRAVEYVAPPVLTSLDTEIQTSEEPFEDPTNASCDTMLEWLIEAGVESQARMVVIYHFGLRASSPKSFEEISQIFYGLNGSVFLPDQLRQQKDAALKKLRDYAEELGIEELSDLLDPA